MYAQYPDRNIKKQGPPGNGAAVTIAAYERLRLLFVML